MFNILIIEDNEFERTFYRHFAQKFEQLEGYKIAKSSQEAILFLENNTFDVIVSDFDLGDGNAYDILAHSGETPVIIVTGKSNELIAADSYRKGIYDYLIKDRSHNYLRKLPTTIINAAEFSKVRSKLSKGEKNYRMLVEFANEIIYMTDRQGFITFINQQGCSILGYDINQLLGKHYTEFIDEDYVITAQEFYRDRYINHIEETYLELPFKTCAGDTIWVGQKVRALFENGHRTSKGLTSYMAFGRDITEKIEAGKHIKYQNLQLEKKNKEVSDTLDQLVKAKASRTANAIILIIALILFVFSEGLLEPIVDNLTQNQYSGLFMKGFIALSLKPLDVFVERILMKRNLNKLKKSDNSTKALSRKRSWILRFMNLD